MSGGKPDDLEDHACNVKDHQKEKAEVGYVLQVRWNIVYPLLQDGLFGQKVCIASEVGLKQGFFLSGYDQHFESGSSHGPAAPKQDWGWQCSILKFYLHLQVTLVFNFLQAPV